MVVEIAVAVWATVGVTILRLRCLQASIGFIGFRVQGEAYCGTSKGA